MNTNVEEQKFNVDLSENAFKYVYKCAIAIKRTIKPNFLITAGGGGMKSYDVHTAPCEFHTLMPDCTIDYNTIDSRRIAWVEHKVLMKPLMKELRKTVEAKKIQARKIQAAKDAKLQAKILGYKISNRITPKCIPSYKYGDDDLIGSMRDGRYQEVRRRWTWAEGWGEYVIEKSKLSKNMK